MRNTVIAALGLLVLVGCSTPAPSSSTTSPAALQPVSGIPSPDAGQSEQLLAALRKIDPALDHDRSIGRARDTCQALLAGEDRAKVVSAARQRFDGTASISTADARKIVKLVEASGWCG